MSLLCHFIMGVQLSEGYMTTTCTLQDCYRIPAMNYEDLHVYMHKERECTCMCVHAYVYPQVASAFEYMINAYVCMFVYFQPNAQGIFVYICISV